MDKVGLYDPPLNVPPLGMRVVFVGQCIQPVFIDVLGLDIHCRVCSQPPTVTVSHYYESQSMVELRQWTDSVEEQTHTMSERLSDMQAHMQR